MSNFPGQTGFKEPVLTKKVIPSDDEVSLGFETINWTDFPVFNLHPHAWPLYDVTRLIGIKFTPEGVELRPTIPQDDYEFSSSLIGFEKTKEGYSGWYNPKKEGMWKVSLELTNEEFENIDSIITNGNENEFIIMGNRVIIIGESKVNKPLSWDINFY